MLLDVVELGLVPDPLLGDRGQRLAELGRAVEDAAVGEVGLPDDVVAGGRAERVEPTGLVRAPEVTNQLDQAPHGAKASRPSAGATRSGGFERGRRELHGRHDRAPGAAAAALDLELGLEVGVVAVAEGEVLDGEDPLDEDLDEVASSCEPETRRSSSIASAELTGWR